MNREASPKTAAKEEGRAGGLQSQFTALGLLFPGLTMLHSVLNMYLGAESNPYLSSLAVFAAALIALRYTWEYIWSLVGGYLTVSVMIRSDDELYNMVMFWLSDQGFAHNSRHSFAGTNTNTRNGALRHLFFDNVSDWANDGDGLEATTKGQSKKRRQLVRFTPRDRSHFWREGRLFVLHRILIRGEGFGACGSENEELWLSSFGSDPHHLKELLLDIAQLYRHRDDDKIVIYRANMEKGFWVRQKPQRKRRISTVITNGTTKEDLIADAVEYLNPMTRFWYFARGIPYRRGYLFHGPPGTGKTTLCLALAGYFGMQVRLINLSSADATEEKLTGLFDALPERCMVLLEDIDCAGLANTREGETTHEETAGASKESSKSVSRRISLSGLLNILDGITAQEGRILCMTTNHVERLDAAVIRHGRVDRKFELGLCTDSMSEEIFRVIYLPHEIGTADTSTADGNGPADAASQKSAGWSTHVPAEVLQLAKDFSAEIPPGLVSPADLQGLLLQYKGKPEKAVRDVKSWVKQMRQERQAARERKGLW